MYHSCLCHNFDTNIFMDYLYPEKKYSAFMWRQKLLRINFDASLRFLDGIQILFENVSIHDSELVELFRLFGQNRFENEFRCPVWSKIRNILEN